MLNTENVQRIRAQTTPKRTQFGELRKSGTLDESLSVLQFSYGKLKPYG